MADDKAYQVSVSVQAAKHIKEQLIKRGTPNGSLRLGVKGGGCSGFSYALIFEDAEPRPNRDLVFQSEGIQIIVDVKSILYLNGCVLDWENTLMSQGYKFINPNEKTKCGCGSSFTV